MQSNKINFEIKVGDEQLKLCIRRPTPDELKEAKKIQNREFREAVESGAILQVKVEEILRSQGIWSAEKQKQAEKIEKEIFVLTRKLKQGGIRKGKAGKIDENSGYGLAMKIKKLRVEFADLRSVRNAVDSNTAEAQAENARMNFLTYACTVYQDKNERYFSSYDDFIELSSQPNNDKFIVALAAINNFMYMYFGVNKDGEKDLPENKFLLQYGFIDKKLNLIDEKGRFITSDGKLIDGNGFYINESGQHIDSDGNLVDDKGEYIVEEQPFLDDNDNPLILQDVSPGG